jgi:hypothetical protein
VGSEESDALSASCSRSCLTGIDIRQALVRHGAIVWEKKLEKRLSISSLTISDSIW